MQKAIVCTVRPDVLPHVGAGCLVVNKINWFFKYHFLGLWIIFYISFGNKENFHVASLSAWRRLCTCI